MNDFLNFICVGFTKCGTTWLYNVLSENSEIDTPILKEPCDYTENYYKGEVWQQSLYKNNGSLKSDFTNHYIFKTVAMDLIKEKNPNVKLLLLIRNPLERSFSHYKMLLSTSTTEGVTLIDEQYGKIID